MFSLIERLFVLLWNALAARRTRERVKSGLLIGYAMKDGRPTKDKFFIPDHKRLEHIVTFGRTGVGKSSLLEYHMAQSLQKGEGMLVFSYHFDLAQFMLGSVAALERSTGKDLSGKFVVINPADARYCVGMDLLEAQNEHQQFVLAAEIARILCNLWGLQNLGARTEELLRNTIIALSAAGFTLVEVQLFLTNLSFRSYCLKRVTSLDVRAYFENRYNLASDAMQGAMRDPILNKISTLVSDPAFRDVLAQFAPAFSIGRALDEGLWVLLMLSKSELGEEASTLGALCLSKFKNAAFARKHRKIFTCFLDEAQNLLAFDTGLDTMLSESRKFGCSIVTAAQFLAQFPPQIRTALLSIGTHICFQLAPQDAEQMATAFDGGRGLAERMKNLPRRHTIVKSGASRIQEVLIPEVHQPKTGYRDLYDRSQKRWGKLRTEIAAEIAARRQIGQGTGPTEDLHAWE